MKKYKLWVIAGIMVVLCIALVGCFPPTIPVVDPDDPIDAPSTIPVAAFSYHSDEYPVQTNSRVKFDGSASYDPDGAIIGGRWDFDNRLDDPDGYIVEGSWVNLVRQWENGEWVWKENPVMQVEYYTYTEPGYYDVKLTVWDHDGNQSIVTRRVRVW